MIQYSVNFCYAGTVCVSFCRCTILYHDTRFWTQISDIVFFLQFNFRNLKAWGFTGLLYTRKNLTILVFYQRENFGIPCTCIINNFYLRLRYTKPHKNNNTFDLWHLPKVHEGIAAFHKHNDFPNT